LVSHFVSILPDIIVIQPRKRTVKIFGHPVYGHGPVRSYSVGYLLPVWPNLRVEQPSAEDVASVADKVKEINLGEMPWAVEGTTGTMIAGLAGKKKSDMTKKMKHDRTPESFIQMHDNTKHHEESSEEESEKGGD